MMTDLKQPIHLGQMLCKKVLGVSVSSCFDIDEWDIQNYPTILVWDCDKPLPSEEINILFRFWINHGARTFVFGGKHGRYVEDLVIEILQKMEQKEGFDELVLTSYTTSFPLAAS